MGSVAAGYGQFRWRSRSVALAKVGKERVQNFV